MADQLCEIHAAGLADGFVISPAFLPDTFDDFVAKVVPILQRRKLLRTAYEPGTLRDRLAGAG